MISMIKFFDPHQKCSIEVASYLIDIKATVFYFIY